MTSHFRQHRDELQQLYQMSREDGVVSAGGSRGQEQWERNSDPSSALPPDRYAAYVRLMDAAGVMSVRWESAATDSAAGQLWFQRFWFSAGNLYRWRAYAYTPADGGGLPASRGSGSPYRLYADLGEGWTVVGCDHEPPASGCR